VFIVLSQQYSGAAVVLQWSAYTHSGVRRGSPGRDFQDSTKTFVNSPKTKIWVKKHTEFGILHARVWCCTLGVFGGFADDYLSTAVASVSSVPYAARFSLVASASAACAVIHSSIAAKRSPAAMSSRSPAVSAMDAAACCCIRRLSAKARCRNACLVSWDGQPPASQMRVYRSLPCRR